MEIDWPFPEKFKTVIHFNRQSIGIERNLTKKIC